MIRLPQHGIAPVLLLAALLCAFSWGPAAVLAQDPGPAEGTGQPEAGGGEGEGEGLKIAWQKGPGVGKLGAIAEVAIPEGCLFAGAEDTKRIMTAFGNPVSGNELGYVSPADNKWFVVFEFKDDGYVKDDEKDSLDHPAMLKSIIAGNEAGNEERKRRGWPTLTITGWEVPPKYDAESHNLEWGIRGNSEGSQVVNYSVRILGRTGVMQADLVLEPDLLATAMPAFRDLLEGYAFSTGNQYSEFKSGDKIAQYTLTALVTGTGIAVAAKTGLLALLGKYIKYVLLGVLAIGVALKKFVLRLFGVKTE